MSAGVLQAASIRKRGSRVRLAWGASPSGASGPTTKRGPARSKKSHCHRDEVMDIYATLATEGLLAHNPVVEFDQVRLGVFFVGAAGEAGESMRW